MSLPLSQLCVWAASTAYFFLRNSDRPELPSFSTDFLCYRGPSMAQYQDVPPGEEGEHLWLGGMTEAAQNLGMEVQ